MKLKSTLILAAFAMAAVPAVAQEAGEWLVRAGAWNISPKSDNSDIVNVDAGQSLGFNVTYFYTDNFAIEVLASLPFSHDINLNGGGQVAETKHLPPTVSAQYHVPVSDTVSVYGGLGLNYTLFFDEETSGALAGTDLDLDASFGVAVQAGLDFRLNEKYFLNADVRWADIDTDATLDGDSLGTVEIDPLVFSLNVGMRF